MKRNIFIAMMMLGLGAQAQSYEQWGTATPEKVLTVPASQLTPGAAAGAKYDRIETVRDIPAGRLTAFAVPATVDGYFFGADAERYEVLSVAANGEGKILTVKKMADLDDFVSGKVYLVRPELGADRLYSYTAGALTAVGQEQRDLECYPVSLPDINGDLKVDVADVTALVSAILTGNTSNIDAAAADVNGDGKFDVADVTLLVNAILRGTNQIIIVEE